MKKIKLKHAEDFYLKVLLNETKIKELMTSPVVSVKVTADFHEVVKKFNDKKIRHLPVVNKDKKLVGLITKRDLYKIKSPRKLEDGNWYYDALELDNFILEKVMVPKPFTLHPDNTIGEALLKMATNKYGCIPIVDKDNELCGILTQMDFLYIAAQILTE